MVRTIVFIVLACVALMAGLTYCAPTKQGTLTLTPAATFPDAHKAELGRSVARIVPFCPGMSMVGKHLVFTNLVLGPAPSGPEGTAMPTAPAQNAQNTAAPNGQRSSAQSGQPQSVSITFTVPDSTPIPAAWGSYNSPCTFQIAGDFLYISEASCQAICLGKQPDTAQDTVAVNLNPKAQNKQ